MADNPPEPSSFAECRICGNQICSWLPEPAASSPLGAWVHDLDNDDENERLDNDHDAEPRT